MSLQMQFDDLVRKVESMDLLSDEHDDYLVEFVVESAQWKRKHVESQAECDHLNKQLDAKRKEVEEVKAKLHSKNSKLECERKRVLALEKERDNLAAIVSNIRDVVLVQNEKKTSSTDLLSILGDISGSTSCD